MGTWHVGSTVRRLDSQADAGFTSLLRLELSVLQLQHGFSGLPWGRIDPQLLGILCYALFVELLSGGVWRSLDPEYIAESKSKESCRVGLLARDKVMRTWTQYVHTFDLRALSLLGLSTSYAAMLSGLVGKGHEDPMAMWNGSNMN